MFTTTCTKCGEFIRITRNRPPVWMHVNGDQSHSPEPKEEPKKRNPSMKKIGEVSVDSGLLQLNDPSYNEKLPEYHSMLNKLGDKAVLQEKFGMMGPNGQRLIIGTGGDGTREVYRTGEGHVLEKIIFDYGTDGPPVRRKSNPDSSIKVMIAGILALTALTFFGRKFN